MMSLFPSVSFLSLSNPHITERRQHLSSSPITITDERSVTPCLKNTNTLGCSLTGLLACFVRAHDTSRPFSLLLPCWNVAFLAKLTFERHLKGCRVAIPLERITQENTGQRYGFDG